MKKLKNNSTVEKEMITYPVSFVGLFLVATMQLYQRVCLSFGRSVRPKPVILFGLLGETYAVYMALFLGLVFTVLFVGKQTILAGNFSKFYKAFFILQLHKKGRILGRCRT